MFTVNNINFEYDVMDAQNAEKFESAMEKVSKINEVVEKEILISQKIRKACNIIFKAIDELFGEGTKNKLFGNSTNLRETCEVWNKIVEGIRNEIKENMNSINV